MAELPEAIILAGGLGTRMREVLGEHAKSMALLNGRPFLETLFKQLKKAGYSQAILSVGYKHEQIRDHFGDESCGLKLIYSREEKPLGTGGGVRLALNHVAADNVLVMNGDSYTDVKIASVIKQHDKRKPAATIVVIPQSRFDAGSIVLGTKKIVTHFGEKVALPGSRYINAGIYILDKTLFKDVSAREAVSIEKQLFPAWLAEGRKIEGYVHKGTCTDIGTPQRYKDAQESLRRAEQEIHDNLVRKARSL